MSTKKDDTKKKETTLSGPIRINIMKSNPKTTQHPVTKQHAPSSTLVDIDTKKSIGTDARDTTTQHNIIKHVSFPIDTKKSIGTNAIDTKKSIGTDAINTDAAKTTNTQKYIEQLKSKTKKRKNKIESLRDREEQKQLYLAEQKKHQDENTTLIYCDGSCLSNGKSNAAAGYGLFFGDNDKRNVSEPVQGPRQTNNEAELASFLRIFQLTSENEKVVIKCDSMYANDVLTSYIPKWKQNHWRKADGKIPVNLSIIKEIDALWTPARQEHTTIIWVEGHSESYGNDEADKLAKLAAYRLQNSKMKATLASLASSDSSESDSNS